MIAMEPTYPMEFPEPPRVKPSLGWIILPILLLMAGAVLLALGIPGFARTVNTPRQPLTAERVVVSEGGTYGIFYEYRVAFALQQDPTFFFTEVNTGEQVRSYFASYSGNYSFNSVKGELVALVDLPAGAYTVEYTDESGGEDRFVLMTSSFVPGLLASIFQTVGGLLCVVFAVVALILILVLRSHSRKRLQESGDIPPRY